MNDKGIQLTINSLVLLALGVIVLLSLIVFFQGSFTPTQESTDAQSAFRNACLEYNARGCCASLGTCGSEDLPSGIEDKAENVGVGRDPTSIHNACCGIDG